MDAGNEFQPHELAGEAGALWLSGLPAFEGVAVAFTTAETARFQPAAGFNASVIDAEGQIAEEFIARVCATVGFAYGRLATCGQVHGTRIGRPTVAERRVFHGCDGLATNLADAPLGVFPAECVPVVLWAPRVGALALLHAGWRGTLAKITAAGVGALDAWWGAAAREVAVFLGPAIGPCCYEVGEEVVAAAAAAFGRKVKQVLVERSGSRRLDLHRANELVAQEAGVRTKNIYRVAACTFCGGNFPSRRRDGGRAGRTVTLAAITARGSRRRGDDQ